MNDPKSYYGGIEHAEMYKTFRRPMPEEVAKNIVNFLSKTFDPSACIAIDVGCGSGQATLRLAPLVRHILGIDPSEAQLCQIDDGSIPDNVKFQVGESESLPFDDSSLHLVNASSALHWFDIPKFFSEVERVLKPGGVLSVSAGGGRCNIEGHVKEANKVMGKMMDDKTSFPEFEEKVKLARNKYRDITFPFKEVLRDESFVDRFVSNVDEYVNSWTQKGGFNKFRVENSEEEKSVLADTKEELMKVLGFEGRPEDATVTLTSNYTLILCRKSV